MPQFTVDEDLAALVERLAKPKPFENLSFNAALRRILLEYINPKEVDKELEQLLAESMALAAANKELEQLLAESMALAAAKKSQKKAPSPSPQQWAASVPELKGNKGLNTWQEVCRQLKINTAGDSARRKLKNWVKANRPNWPPVPEISGE